MNPVVKLLLLAYAGEPCGVCGEDISEADLLEEQDVVFSDYRTVRDRVSRSSHGPCWRGLTDEQRAEFRASGLTRKGK